MPSNSLVALVEKIVTSRSSRKIDMDSCLDLCELVRMRIGNARPVLSATLSYINSFDNRRAFFAVNLMETLMLNGGFPVRFLMSRKEMLNELVKRFPASAKTKSDEVEEYILLLLAKWSKSLSERSIRKDEYVNFKLMVELLKSKVVPAEEIEAMLSDEIERKLTPKEELLAEDRLVLETVPFATILTNVEIGEDRGWKEQVINNALENQLAELQDQLDSLQLLSDSHRKQVVEEIKETAPRLVRLARSESLDGALLEKVLTLNDQVRQVISAACITEQHQSTSIATESREVKNIHADIAYCDVININGRRFARILNHSDDLLHDIKVDLEGRKVLAADFLSPNETLTARLKQEGMVSVWIGGRHIKSLEVTDK